MVDSCPVDIHSFILTLCDTPDYKGPTSTLRAMYLVMSCIAFDLSIVDILCRFSFSFPFPFFCIIATYSAVVLLRPQQPNVTLVVTHHG